MDEPYVWLQNCPEGLQPALREALAAEGLFVATADAPAVSLALIWLDPHSPATDRMIAELRQRWRHCVPALAAIVPATEVSAIRQAAALELDAIFREDTPETLAAQAVLLYQARRRFLDANPLTGLPGANALARELQRWLAAGEPFALLAFDVDRFKSYNDFYGYQRGDELLRGIARFLQETFQEKIGGGYFLAHLGGDDFFALAPREKARTVAEAAVANFRMLRAQYYDPPDLARGGIIVRNRQGELVFVPLVTLTATAATNEANDVRHSGQLAAILAELKAYAKARGGDRFVWDRRQIHDAEESWRRRQELAAEGEARSQGGG